jgi:hypothetical protein
MEVEALQVFQPRLEELVRDFQDGKNLYIEYRSICNFLTCPLQIYSRSE